MLTSRTQMGGAVINGKLYVAGGVSRSIPGTPGTILASLEVYDPATDIWTAKTPMPTPQLLTGAGAINGVLYVVSGQNASTQTVNTVQAYNPATDSWTTVAPIPTARYGPEPQGISGVLYVAGNGAGNVPIAANEGFTPPPTYSICPLYDQTKSVKSGATFPIKLQLCDANGNDLSSSGIVVHATSVTAISGFSGTPGDAGSANPDNDFRFDITLGPTGGYIFNLSTSGLASGTYSLAFTAGSDPFTHSVNFGVQ